MITLVLTLGAAGAAPPTLDAITPAAQRVHDVIMLRGVGFGAYEPGVSLVVFTAAGDPGIVVEGGTPYVWRDELIQLRVPVQVPRAPLEIHVVSAGGASGPRPFEVITAAGATLAFVQRTEIVDSHDVSSFLGPPEFNLARTKDADIGDVDGDGFPDLIDDNSHNLTNGTHAVLRLNDRGRGFVTVAWEPLDAADTGVFATTIPPGGDYFGNGLSYDSDFVDLDNDGLVDWVQAATEPGFDPRVRVAMNNDLGEPGRFIEDTAAWFPGGNGLDGAPDDIAHADVDHDGYVDIAVAYRLTDTAAIYLNQAGRTFAAPILIEASGSIHDVLFIDANGDGFHDVVVANESGPCELHLHQGGAVPTFAFHTTFPTSATSGVAADLDGDGLDDLALVQSQVFAHVYLNDPDAPGTFTAAPLPDAVFGLYDVEAGDLDLDGDVDLVSPAIIFGNEFDDTVRVWLNDGAGGFVNATSPGASALLPGIGAFQRLSADLIDFDLDGDLDLYVTGADTSGVDGIGDVPNQFFESLVDPVSGPAPGDVNGDGAVDVEDLVAVILAWGPCPAPPLACPEDADGDGTVDVDDLIVVVLGWSR